MSTISLTGFVEEPARRSLSWRGFHVEHVVPAPGDRFGYAWQSDLHFCAFHDIVLRDGAVRAGDVREHRRTDLRGSLTYVPSGAPVEGWSQLTPRRNAYTAIYFDPAALHEELEGRFPDDAEPRIYFSSPTLAANFRRFEAHLGEGDPDQLFAETLGLMIVLDLQKAALPPAQRRPSLSRNTLARVVDYVDQNLGRPLSLSDLASVAGLSRFHFNRAFKAATGGTPYQYVIAQRIDRARRLMMDPALTIEEVAAVVGFRDGSHFQKAFRRSEGVNPRDFRKRAC